MQGWAHLQLQATPDPLIPNEEFGAGGLDTVRGYLESETLGDNAAALQLELRSPSLAERIGPPIDELRFHAFSDLAEVSINQPLPEQGNADPTRCKASAPGCRMRLFDASQCRSLEDAVTLDNSASSTRSGSNRVLFRVFGEF